MKNWLKWIFDNFYFNFFFRGISCDYAFLMWNISCSNILWLHWIISTRRMNRSRYSNQLEIDNLIHSSSKMCMHVNYAVEDVTEWSVLFLWCKTSFSNTFISPSLLSSFLFVFKFTWCNILFSMSRAFL